jgi:hypothetical protein
MSQLLLFVWFEKMNTGILWHVNIKGGHTLVSQNLPQQNNNGIYTVNVVKAGSLKMNTTLEYSTRVVQEGGRRCKKSALNDLVHLTPLRIPSMNPPLFYNAKTYTVRPAKEEDNL